MSEAVREDYERMKRRYAEYAVAHVPSMWREGVEPDAIYPHECYYRAYQYATHVDRLTENGVWLVHGETCLAFGGHAWVELPDGLAFDGVFQQFYPLSTYYDADQMMARTWYKYTPDAAFLIFRNMPLTADGEYQYSWDTKLRLPFISGEPMIIDFQKAKELLVANGLMQKSEKGLLMRKHFQDIKRLFFQNWARQDRWKVTTRSRRRVHGHCDPERRVIEIVVQHKDPDERDKLLIHEICHAASSLGHGKVWQDRMERAARRSDELGRDRLAQLLREEITNYQQAAEGLKQAYQTIQDWVMCNPDLTLSQVKRALANQYGLLYSEVSKSFRRLEKVFREAKRDAEETQALKQVWR